MKIYLATSWKNPYQEVVLNELERYNFDVYDFKHPVEGDNGFHWSSIDPKWETWTREEYIRRITREVIAIRGFRYDIQALNSCDACVLVLPCGRSAHLEAGYAIGKKKPTGIFLLGEEDETVPELMYLMADKLATDIYDLVSWLKIVEAKL